MERDITRKKAKIRENLEERSPLQHLNGLPSHKRITKNCSDLSSSSAPAASRFVLSDNPCSSSSFAFSSPRTHLDKKPNTFSKMTKYEPNKSRVHTPNLVPRSKENEMPRKPFLQTSRKEKPLFITQRHNWQSGAKPTSKNRQRSKLSSVQSNVMTGSREFQKKKKISGEIDSGKCAFELNRVSNGSSSNCADNCTHVSGRVGSETGSPSIRFCDHEFAIGEASVSVSETADDNGDATDVKTPPVEVSLSPEIQSHSQSKKMSLKKSVGTPVCYGAGHLLSGVSDKRKCRRRGSLRGGPEKTILFLDAREDGNESVSVDLKESLIPLPAEASVRWHLSPCDVEREDQGIGLDQGSTVVCDDDSDILDLLCGNTLDFLCAKSSYSGKGSSVLSDVSLSSGNIIQTQDSDSSSDATTLSNNCVWSELDSMTETLETMKLSPRSEISMCDAPVSVSDCADIGSPPISHDPNQLHKQVDCVSSWMSDATTVDDLTLSQISISWCEGLASKVGGTDEFDCSCGLSDEEIDGDEQNKLFPLTEAAEEEETCHGNNSGQRNNLGVASVEDKEDEFSPVHLDYEPCLHGGGKRKLSSHGPNNAGAESICTDGGGLVASDDSDWPYFQESCLFHDT